MRHWPPGQQLHQGKYLIEEILGGGGFGVTYRAQNRKEGKLVAIKTLNANVQGKPNFREFQTKFVNEALSLAKCSHPHVVQVYEVFPETVGNIELWCMVMELIDGIDLASHLEDNGILSEAKALPIVQQVGSALSCVHKQGFTHLDVKPQNIMIRTPPAPLLRGEKEKFPPLIRVAKSLIPPLIRGARGVQFITKPKTTKQRHVYVSDTWHCESSVSWPRTVVCCSICPAICGL